MKNKFKKILCLFLVFIFVSYWVHLPVLSILIILTACLLLISKLTKRNEKRDFQKKSAAVTEEKERHYHAQGMTDSEIKFFRETMASARQQIIQLEKNLLSATKLKVIDLHNDTIRVTQALFKEIVKEPLKLHQADQFLYTHLPNIVELTDKYLEIESHEIKNKQTYEKLNQSLVVIEEVSLLLVKDYEKFVADDFTDLEVEISIAKQSLARDTDFNSMRS